MEGADPDQTRRKLHAWLANQWPDASDLTIDATRLPSETGNSAESSFVDVSYALDGERHRRSLVLRRQLEGNDIFLDSGLELPFRMMQAMARHSTVPVPPVIGIEFDRAILGSPFLVMEAVPGRIVAQHPNYNVQGWLAELAPHRRTEVWCNAIDAMAAINRLDWREGFEFLDRPQRGPAGLAQYVNALELWYRWAANGREVPLLETALAYLRNDQPAGLPVSVLWGDSHVSNILFRDDLSVAAVIDWEAAALGVAEVDFGYWLFFDEVFSTGVGVARLAGLPDRGEMTARYENALGRPVRDLAYFEILAAMRFAIVLLRFADRMLALGRIPAGSEARTRNPATLLLAQKLGVDPPGDLADFLAMSAAAGRG